MLKILTDALTDPHWPWIGGLVRLLILLLFASPLLAQQPPPAPDCDETLWTHVYHPNRLQITQRCLSVVGVIVDASKGRNKDGARHEADGDSHSWLKLDPGQETLLLRGNIEAQEGNLVVEVICRYKITQKDAVAVCKNYKNKVKLPPVGSHVRITGALVADLDHQPIHSEIHPPTAIEVLH